jgi:hypothetical protein
LGNGFYSIVLWCVIDFHDFAIGMKETDLRIGNWVRDFGSSKPRLINTSMLSNWAIIKRDHQGYEPITLTEEWLLRFGYNKRSTHEKRINSKLYYTDRKTRINIIYIYGGYKFSAGHGIIQYVHQLQNLYHALTGEELELKE